MSRQTVLYLEDTGSVLPGVSLFMCSVYVLTIQGSV